MVIASSPLPALTVVLRFKSFETLRVNAGSAAFAKVLPAWASRPDHVG
jgi:hypothetical protein